MEKEFDTWNLVKKVVNKKVVSRDLFFHEREVWWCSLGLNVGVETDGKNEDYERPVLIIKKFNSHMLWVAPLTSKIFNDKHHRKVTHEFGFSWACISQLRTVSTKRLLRKIGMTNENDFKSVIDGIISYIKIETPTQGGGISEPEGTNR